MMGKTIAKIFRCFMNILSIFIVAISIILLISVIFTAKNDIPDVMGYSMLRVLTGSMEPNLPENALIVIKKEMPAALKEGDIISFYSADPDLNGMINTHRITRIEKQDEKYIFYTKGDCNQMEDAVPTDEEHILGKVIWNNQKLGKLVRLVANPLVFLPVIIAPLVLILTYHLWQLVHTTKKISDEQEKAYQEAVLKLYEKKKKEKKEK